MTSPLGKIAVRRCRLRDVPALCGLIETSWHAANDPLMGRDTALAHGRHVYARFPLAVYVTYSRLFPRTWAALVATASDALQGFALLQRDGTEIILYMLYVHPERQRQGVGTALLDAGIASLPGAKAIRLEVLQANTAAIAWYKSQGFESYGETANATGTTGVPALYMDRKIGGG